MWGKLKIEKGVEWISKDIKITVRKSSDFIDVFLFPDYPHKKRQIALYLMLNVSSATVMDLINNSHKDCWGKGWGTLIFNTGIQALRAWYDKDVDVTGEIFEPKSPDEETARRHHFWSSFGFKFEPDNGSEISDLPINMTAKLSELKLKTEGFTEKGTPKMIPLNQFWRRIHRPRLFKEIFEAATKIDLEKLSPQNIGVDDRGSGPRLVEKVTKYFMSNSHRSQNNLAEHTLTSLEYIQALEEEHNGFVWRLYEGLKTLYRSLDKENYRRIAELSKCRFDYGLARHKDDYFQFCKEIKTIIDDKPLESVLFFRPETKNINDFFFGDVDGSILLNSLSQYALFLDKKRFSGHINRLLAKLPDNYLIVSDGTSFTAGFEDVVKRLDDICLVELYPYGDKESSLCTLRSKFFLINGVLDFQFNWCAYKKTRGDELFDNLGVLYSEALLEKIYYLNDGKRVFVPQKPYDFVVEILDLIMDRHYDDNQIEKFAAIFERKNLAATN